MSSTDNSRGGSDYGIVADCLFDDQQHSIFDSHNDQFSLCDAIMEVR